MNTNKINSAQLFVVVIGGAGLLLSALSVHYHTGDREWHRHSGQQPRHSLATAYGAASDRHHDHAMQRVLPEGIPAPDVDFTLVRDLTGGWNLSLSVTNFRFAPQSVNTEHVAGEGHAHVYVNGVKLARLYAPWFHIPELPEGETAVTVTLNANDHATLAVGDRPLSITKTIDTNTR